MKKSNWIVYGSLAAVSIFLLWLWYFLELYLIDSPADLILSIVWWVVIAGCVLLVYRVERSRKSRIRTLFVADTWIYNPEVGTMQYHGNESFMQVAKSTLGRLRFNFTHEALPRTSQDEVVFLVRTKAFTSEVWEGEVAVAGEAMAHPFSTEADLSQLVNRVRAKQTT